MVFENNMKIGILGGTFNPIHNGHLLIAQEVCEEFNLDKIYFIPNKLPPHKIIKDTIADIHRINMIKLAISNNNNFHIDDREIKRGGISYTIDTIKEIIKEIDLIDKIHLIIGADLLPELHLWKDWEELSQISQFVVLNRDQTNITEYKTKYPFIKTLNNTVQFDVSSSLIRDKIKNNKSVRYLVSEQVKDYIKKENLYVR